MSQADLPPDILALPIAERVELVGKIWDSIAEDAAIGLTDDDHKILDQRLADHQKHPEQGVSWEALKKELRDGQ
jgi:putative addiction module component (TIGR02574 family)